MNSFDHILYIPKSGARMPRVYVQLWPYVFATTDTGQQEV